MTPLMNWAILGVVKQHFAIIAAAIGRRLDIQCFEAPGQGLRGLIGGEYAFTAADESLCSGIKIGHISICLTSMNEGTFHLVMAGMSS